MIFIQCYFKISTQSAKIFLLRPNLPQLYDNSNYLLALDALKHLKVQKMVQNNPPCPPPLHGLPCRHQSYECCLSISKKLFLTIDTYST